MNYDHPTAGDYAWAAANEADRKAKANNDRIAQLEDRVKHLEKIVARIEREIR